MTWRPHYGPAYPSAHSCLLHFPWCWSQEHTLINCLHADLHLSVSHWSGTSLNSRQQREIVTSANGVNSAGQEATVTSQASDTEYKVHRAKGRESGGPVLEKLLVQWAPRQDKLGEVQSCPMRGAAAPAPAPAGNGFKYTCSGLTQTYSGRNSRVFIKPSR